MASGGDALACVISSSLTVHRKLLYLDREPGNGEPPRQWWEWAGWTSQAPSVCQR